MRELVILQCLLSVWLSMVRFTVGQQISAFNPADSTSFYPPDSLISPGAAFPFGNILPSSRVHHSVSANSDYILVYGGYSSKGDKLGDLQLFHIASQTWSGPILREECCNDQNEVVDTIGIEQDPKFPFLKSGFEGDFPLPRAEHSSCVVQDELYVFGGVTDLYSYMHDLYRFNTNTLRWKSLDVTVGDGIPERRAGHGTVADEKKQCFYLFGGRAAVAGREYGLNDVWKFDIMKSSWTRLGSSVLTKPIARQYMATALVDGLIYVFGGSDPSSGKLFNDLWTFDVTKEIWTNLFPTNSDQYRFQPPPLAHAHIFPSLYSSGLGKFQGVLVYGGMGSGSGCISTACNALQVSLGQLYLYSNSSQSWASPFTFTDSSHWLYARLTTSLPGIEPFREYRGKYVKTYAMEKLIYVPGRKLVYEFGGVEVQDKELIRNFQQPAIAFDHNHRVDEVNRAVLQDVGGPITSTFSDIQTGEQLRSNVDLPTNGYWSYEYSFSNFDANGKAKVSYLRAFRTFAVADRDMSLVMERKGQ